MDCFFKKTFMLMTLLTLMVAGSVAQAADTATCVITASCEQKLEGTGTEEDPFLISDIDDWNSFTAADHSVLYLGAGNKLYSPAPSDASHPFTINAQRAYFRLDGLTVGGLRIPVWQPSAPSN